jgi:hypothetical protein
MIIEGQFTFFTSNSSGLHRKHSLPWLFLSPSRELGFGFEAVGIRVNVEYMPLDCLSTRCSILDLAMHNYATLSIFNIYA